MTRRRMSTSRRARIFEAAGRVCHICGHRIDGTRERWDADHVTPLEISGDDTDDNLRPAHEACHRVKTGQQDAPTIAKAKSVAGKHIGAHKSRSPLPGGRGSKLKRKIDGSVVPRDDE